MKPLCDVHVLILAQLSKDFNLLKRCYRDTVEIHALSGVRARLYDIGEAFSNCICLLGNSDVSIMILDVEHHASYSGGIVHRITRKHIDERLSKV